MRFKKSDFFQKIGFLSSKWSTTDLGIQRIKSNKFIALMLCNVFLNPFISKIRCTHYSAQSIQ